MTTTTAHAEAIEVLRQHAAVADKQAREFDRVAAPEGERALNARRAIWCGEFAAKMLAAVEVLEGMPLVQKTP